MNNFEEIRRVALEAGFDLFGVADPFVDKADFYFFEEWVEKGYGAGMSEWLSRSAINRSDPSSILDGIKSVICLGVNYYPGERKDARKTGLIARYAWGDDYHKTIGDMCKPLCNFLIKNYGDEPKWYTDTGAIFERYFAVKAGLGFIGKNTCLITREFGSWVFLAIVFSRIDFKPIKKMAFGSCGFCDRCLKACPTGALSEKCVDSRKCISYLTIEKRGEFSEAEKALVAGQKFCFGCDVCQEVCPHNVRTKKTDRFNPRIESLSEGNFSPEMLTGSPFKRAKQDGIVRNLAAIQTI